MHCKGQPRLYSSLLKYGWNNHSFEVIHELPKDVSQDTLDQYECFYWQQYKDCNSIMLNLKEPGFGGRLSEETKQRMRASQSNRTWNDKISEVKQGIVFSDSHKNNLSKAASKPRSKAWKESKGSPILHIESGVKYISHTEAAKAFGCWDSTIRRRLKKGIFISL